MATRKNTPKPPVEGEQYLIILNEHQACNEFCLTGTTRAHILKKYIRQMNTKEGWKEIFKGERVV